MNELRERSLHATAKNRRHATLINYSYLLDFLLSMWENQRRLKSEQETY